jgi:hypothetical protein
MFSENWKRLNEKGETMSDDEGPRSDRDFGFISTEIDEGTVRVDINRAIGAVVDTRKILEDFHARMVTRIDRTFDLAGGPGSVEKGGYDPFRNILWEPLAPQSKRASGKVIPAWGGVPRKDGKGMVKGRTRPSGKRVNRGDALNQDSGRFRQRAATGYVAITKDSLTFGPNLNYSNWIENIRPAVFISDSDASLFERLLDKYIFGSELDEREEI